MHKQTLVFHLLVFNIYFPGSKSCPHPKINHPRFFTLLCQVLKDLDRAVRGNVYYLKSLHL